MYEMFNVKCKTEIMLLSSLEYKNINDLKQRYILHLPHLYVQSFAVEKFSSTQYMTYIYIEKNVENNFHVIYHM